jgi:Uma2 family endonuclease
MTRTPLEKPSVSSSKVVLEFKKVGITDEQFLQLCRDNRDLRFELSAQKELIVFGPFCPDFAAEVVSPSNTPEEVQEKMAEYLANGLRSGWLIDPYEAAVYIYRAGKPVEHRIHPEILTGDPVLPGFTFNVTQLW